MTATRTEHYSTSPVEGGRHYAVRHLIGQDPLHGYRFAEAALVTPDDSQISMLRMGSLSRKLVNSKYEESYSSCVDIYFRDGNPVRVSTSVGTADASHASDDIALAVKAAEAEIHGLIKHAPPVLARTLHDYVLSVKRNAGSTRIAQAA